MLDHIGSRVSDFAASRSVLVAEGKAWGMLSRDGKGQFWFGACGPSPAGKDNGAPGIWTQYHPDYHAAFVIAPGGHNVEAVMHMAISEAESVTGASA